VSPAKSQLSVLTILNIRFSILVILEIAAGTFLAPDDASHYLLLRDWFLTEPAFAFCASKTLTS